MLELGSSAPGPESLRFGLRSPSNGHGCRSRFEPHASDSRGHLPRSGLLKDWTKVPPVPRKGDDTFDRVYGPKSTLEWEPASATIGKVDNSTPSILREGPLNVALKTAHYGGAELDVQSEEGILEEMNQARYFETTTGVGHQKPDYTVAQKAGRNSRRYKQEIFCGPEPDVMPSLENEGLEVPFHAHYSRVDQITNTRMFMADPEFRGNVAASAPTGVGPFHRNAQFTKGCDKFILHVHKDEGLNEMYQRLPETNPMRQLGGENASDPHAGIPSLAALKGAIHRKVQEVWGPLGYVNLRQRLCELCDHEGFIRKSDVVEVLREPLGLSEEEVEAKPLDVWLCQLCTMKKAELKASTFMSSLRPALPQKEKRRVLTAFKLLQGPNGSARLGDWLQRLDDGDLKQTVIFAFGAEDEESVANTAVTEQVFLELFSDLAPFADIGPMLE
ncbi:Uncharacterized protein SCF082_LOCUS49930 [Durusdinium trenchii]|uniref:Uncharacterized protein n=1 Tax=Durusdinium trenchii TaxID=1381693 RepID=A0ABP0S3D2_9DINO